VSGPIDLTASHGYVVQADNLAVLSTLADESFQLVYIDPPFNTGSPQQRRSLQTSRDEAGDRRGFGGHRYSTVETARTTYPDVFDDYLAFIEPRLVEARRVLAPSGTLYFHIDWREAHYCKVLLDTIFGRDCFLNEVIWAYDYGGRARDRWPAKHDTILVYVKDIEAHFFDQQAITRIPYLAPGLVTPEKAARGKLPTDVWWHTIVPTNGKEKTGYPSQKPEGVLRRVLEPSTRPGDWVLDFFAGSGTTAAVAALMGRRFVMVDCSPEACQVMARRLGTAEVVYLDDAALGRSS
jgi:site-specific DNA-methyltransferase (adenine-specific)